MENSLVTLPLAHLKKIVQIREKLESLNTQLNSVLGGRTSVGRRIPQKRKMSAAGRARIAAGAKARWAKVKAGTSTEGKIRRKKTVSSAARAKLSAIAKARWAKIRAAGKSKL
jgi:hypothetical protein